ncbi:hypothetical protein D3C77_505080 [compost metagenome]
MSMSYDSAEDSAETKSDNSAASESLKRSFDGPENNASPTEDGTGAGSGDPASRNGFSSDDKSSPASDTNNNGKKAAQESGGAKGDGSSKDSVNTPGNSSGDAAGHTNSDSSRSAENRSVTKNEPSSGSPDQGEPAQSNAASDMNLGDSMMEMAPFDPNAPTADAPAQPYGIANIATPEEWSSPDGTYRAVLLANHLYIYKVNNEEYLLAFDEQVKGSWVKGEWSNDGNKFTYEAEVDGSVTKHAIELGPSANAENSPQNQ